MSNTNSKHNGDTTNGKRKLWNIDTEFVSIPIFQNSLPCAPSGPFYKSVPFNSFDKFSTYHVSTLEKSYAWQPHFPEAGVKLDLVDQESFLIPSKVPQLEPLDLKYIHNISDVNNRSKQRRAALVTEVNEKPWWLRNTVYLENNLYNQPITKSKALESDPSIKRIEDPSSEGFIQESFEKIKKIDVNIQNQQNLNQNVLLKKAKEVKLGKKSSDVKLEWCVPILPNSSLFQDPLVPVRFGEDIDKLVSIRNQTNDLDMDVLYSIITNLRQRTSTISNTAVNDKSFNASLISPTSCSTSVNQTEYNETGTKGIGYSWVADFQMDIFPDASGDEFLMKLDSSFSSSNNQASRVAAEYWPVKSRIDLRKLPVSEWVPHEAEVSRRSVAEAAASADIDDPQMPAVASQD